MDNLRIELLADHLEALPMLRELFETEWSPYYGEGGPGNAEKDIQESCGRTELPIALVAIFN